MAQMQKTHFDKPLNLSSHSLLDLGDAGIEGDIFNNNDPESINSLIQRWEAKEKDMATFLAHMKALHEKQRHDVKGAFHGIFGLYTIKEEYEEFAASTDF